MRGKHDMAVNRTNNKLMHTETMVEKGTTNMADQIYLTFKCHEKVQQSKQARDLMTCKYCIGSQALTMSGEEEAEAEERRHPNKHASRKGVTKGYWVRIQSRMRKRRESIRQERIQTEQTEKITKLTQRRQVWRMMRTRTTEDFELLDKRRCKGRKKEKEND